MGKKIVALYTCLDANRASNLNRYIYIICRDLEFVNFSPEVSISVIKQIIYLWKFHPHLA
jgi:hypothetical protein